MGMRQLNYPFIYKFVITYKKYVYLTSFSFTSISRPLKPPLPLIFILII